MCVFYRLTRDVMQLKKPSNIKTKQVKITKTKNINVCTNNHCKFTNSNKQFCGRSNRVSIAKLLTRYLEVTLIYFDEKPTILIFYIYNMTNIHSKSLIPFC